MDNKGLKMVKKGPKNVDYLQKHDFCLSKSSCEFLGHPSPLLQTKSAKKYLTVSLNTTMNDLKLIGSAICLL